MVFDLHRFLQGEKPPANVPFTADSSRRDFGGVQVPSPAECNFSAQLAAEGAALALAVKAVAEGVCARCLGPVRRCFDFTCEYLVRPRELADPDFELPLDENGCLDVEELAYQELYLAIPRVLLCSPDCPGLCAVCGQRKDACTCAPTTDAAPADARLNVLKKLLGQDPKEVH